MMPLSDFVRMPKGSTQTFLLNSGEESYFLKKLATYSARAKAKVEYDMWLCIRVRDDIVQRMAVCKVVTQGKELRRKRVKREQ